MNDHLSVSWFAHNSNLVETISDLYHKNVFCDVTVVCEGKYFPLHKLILCSQSEYFRELLEKAQCKHPFIILRDTTAQDFAALMQFIYKGSVEVPRERVSLLMKAGDDMKIKGLYTSENNEVRYFSQIEEEITSYTPPESSFSVSSNEHNLNKPSQENYHIFDEAMPTNTLASNEKVSLSTNDVQPIIAVKKESLLQERTSHQRKRRSVGASESINDKAEVLKIPNVVIESCPEAIHLAKRLKTSVSSEIEIIEQEKNHPVTSTAAPSSLLVLPKLVTATSSEVETEDGEDQTTTSGRVSVENTSEQGEKTTVDEILPFPPAVTVNEIAADIKMEDSFLDFSNEIDFDFEESKDEPSLAASAVPLEQPVLPSIPTSNLPSTNGDASLPIDAATSDPLIIAEKKNSANTAQNEPRKSCRRKLGETHFPEEPGNQMADLLSRLHGLEKEKQSPIQSPQSTNAPKDQPRKVIVILSNILKPSVKLQPLQTSKSLEENVKMGTSSSGNSDAVPSTVVMDITPSTSKVSDTLEEIERMSPVPVFKPVAKTWADEEDLNNMNSTKRGYKRPRRPCIFCSEKLNNSFRNLTRHLKTTHKHNKKVKRILKLPKKQQKFEFDFIRKLGINNYNKKIYTSGRKNATLMRERNQGSRSSSELSCCPNCSGIYLRRTISHHIRYCRLQKTPTLSRSNVNKLPIHCMSEEELSAFQVNVIRSLCKDKISACIRENKTLQKVGEVYFNKLSHSSKMRVSISSTRQELRTISHIFVKFRESFAKLAGVSPDTVKLEEMFSRQSREGKGMKLGINLKILREVIIGISKRDTTTRARIYSSLKRTAKALCLIYTQNDREKEASEFTFWEVVFSNKNRDIFAHSIYSASSIKPENPKNGRLICHEDILIIKKYIMQELENCSLFLPTAIDFVYLRALLLTRLSFLNGGLGGQVTKLTLKNYQQAKNDEWISKELKESLTVEDLQLLERYKLTFVEGKNESTLVPLLISPECLPGLDLLCSVDIRAKWNVNTQNDFVFAPTGCKMYHVCSTSDIAVIVKKVPNLSRQINARAMKHYVSMYASRTMKCNAKGKQSKVYLEKEIQKHVHENKYGIEEVMCVATTLDNIDIATKKNISRITANPMSSSEKRSQKTAELCQANVRACWSSREEAIVKEKFGKLILNSKRNPSKADIYQFMSENPEVLSNFTTYTRYVKIRSKLINMKREFKFAQKDETNNANDSDEEDD